MDNNETEKTPIAASKSFMAVGPTLHYSHQNVQRCWLLAFAAFCVSCIFWSKIVTGSFRSFDIVQAVASLEFWHLGQSLVTGVSIFEYPWQIFVLGQLMGILAVVPVLISQLMSFRHSLLFILVVFFLANLPGFAICLLISCIAAACRPLRFRSRFIAIALCTTPQLVYWACFGSAKGLEPVERAFTFSPWICAWLAGLGIAGIVLGIGHYTRYRPGLVWIATTVVFLAAITEFEMLIGFDELDYQLYVANNNPEQTAEFHEHSITEALTETIDDPKVRKYLSGFFYPDDRMALRVALKKEIVIRLGQDRWPRWFIVPDELKYQDKRKRLFEQYDTFINRRLTSPRMPIAIYYKALLGEYSPDTKVLGQKEILRFYNDYPHRESLLIWYRLYGDFPQSSESLEARWRIAKDWAGQGKFEQADELLVRAREMVSERLKRLKEEQQTQSDAVFGLFRSPADSVMTASKLTELQRRVNQLRMLIGTHNRTDETESVERLSRFVMLNPHSFEYEQHLDGLLEQVGDNDPLRDNVLLAQAKLVVDEQNRADILKQLHKDFKETDGGMQALYELGLLKISFWRQQDESDSEQKKQLLADARQTLADFIELYPSSFCAEQVNKNLADLPGVE